MKKFGLVGYGKWGKILFKTISSIGKVLFISNTKRTYKNKKNIDHCFVATSDSTHYKIVKYFLKNKIPVFCEKPLSRNLKQSKELIKFCATSLRLDLDYTLTHRQTHKNEQPHE